MKKKIALHEKEIEYTLKVSKKASSMRLTVYPGGEFVVTALQGIHEGLIEQFIVKKSQWVIDKIEYFKQFSGHVFLKSGKRDFVKYKNEALILVQSRIKHFNTIYDFKFNKVTIKNQKSRWGSCSKKGNINFNYKIALLPQELADYIIVHELCHLGEFNHSRKFWNLVEKAIPNYPEIKNKLKKTGLRFS
ncbi:MAG: M48 family metallopeptidase [Patescibacteria group bacterium]